MHESFEFYQKCKQRSSNKGLYTADQNLNRGKGARATRQNPNGNRRGLECPEERDYYPYWAPSPWRDIAVITQNPERCDYYKSASQNVMARGECVAAEDFFPANHIYESKCRMGTSKEKPAKERKDRGEWFNNKDQCEASGHKWVPAWYDLKHPASQKALKNLQALKVTDTGKMNYEVFEYSKAEAGSRLCNTQENKDLESGKKEEDVPMTAEGWEVVGDDVVVNKDGTVDIPKESTKQKGDIRIQHIYSKKMFKAPVKVEFTYTQGPYADGTSTNEMRPECMRSFVFPTGTPDNWKTDLNGRRNQFTQNAWGKEPFYQTDSIGHTRLKDVMKPKATDYAGCFFKMPDGCPTRNPKRPDTRKAEKFKDWKTEGHDTEEKCTKRAEEWKNYCNATIETKWQATSIWTREDQKMTVEVWSNMTATMSINGKWIANAPMKATEGRLAFVGCVPVKLKGVKVTQPGMYGRSTADCETNLRNDMTGQNRIAHTFGASFVGEAKDCNGAESAAVCNSERCPEGKVSASRKVQRLSGYFMPTKAGSFTFSAKGAYGMELWLNDKKLITNNKQTGTRINSAAQNLQAGQGYRLQAFSIAQGTKETGCFVRVPGGCTKQEARYKGYGDPEKWERDYASERDRNGRNSHFSEHGCLGRIRDFDQWCFEDANAGKAEMKWVSPSESNGDLQLGVKIGEKTYDAMKTAADEYKICTDATCSEPQRQCQTKATEECECDNWSTRAPAQWGLTKDAGNCCMRPTYDMKTGPWCYCKGKKGGDSAICDPKLSSHKGKLTLVESIDEGSNDEEWTEVADTVISLVEQKSEESVAAPLTGPTRTTVDKPEIATVHCVDGTTSTSRENQLGNARNTANPLDAIPHGLNANRYIWTIPDHLNDNCIVRLRYNISTSDYADWANDGTPLTTSAQNAKLKNNKYYVGPDGKPTTSPIMQDPYVGIGADPQKTFLSLAINTNQYGRTFQDRSYVFAIKKRPDGIAKDANIYNVNMRGKRGNIVQTYPAVEYDFVPNDLCTKVGDYVHFQWTGSDYNPQRNPNDGEGGGDSTDPNAARRADRTNLVEMDVMGNTIKFPVSETRTNNEGPFPESKNQTGAGRVGEVALGMNYPAGALGDWANLDKNYKGMFWTANNKPDTATIEKLAFIDQHSRLKAMRSRCKTLEELNAVPKQDDRERDPANCAKLNGAREPYFDGGLVQMRKAGKFSYFSSRNNNFSNRNQAGCICVGQNSCNNEKSCQANIEEDLRKNLKAEKKNGSNLLEMSQPTKQTIAAECDAACVSKLRAKVESLTQEVNMLKSGL
jgi:hypothetical protein